MGFLVSVTHVPKTPDPASLRAVLPAVRVPVVEEPPDRHVGSSDAARARRRGVGSRGETAMVALAVDLEGRSGPVPCRRRGRGSRSFLHGVPADLVIVDSLDPGVRERLGSPREHLADVEAVLLVRGPSDTEPGRGRPTRRIPRGPGAHGPGTRGVAHRRSAGESEVVQRSGSPATGSSRRFRSSKSKRSVGTASDRRGRASSGAPCGSRSCEPVRMRARWESACITLSRDPPRGEVAERLKAAVLKSVSGWSVFRESFRGVATRFGHPRCKQS